MSSKVLTVCLAVSLLASLAPAGALSTHFNPETMMPSSEVRRGMKAVGKSVFSGIEITEFNMEILAVLEKANLGKDLIIGKILDGPVVERESGVMGGMSGSPVYVDGRLIGAIAYTWNFEREPIAGITAIDSMLQSLDKPEKQQALSPFATSVERYSSLRGGFEIAGKRISQVRIVPRSEARSAFADDHTMVLCRVTPPVYCGGVPQRAREYLKDVLEPHGIEPIAGPGAKRDPVDTDLVPGAAFGALLVSGDFDISTAGTVTYREGDLLLAFGHPFMEMGKVDIPLTTAWVHDFIPCYSRTDKLMSPMKEVGALTQDRTWSVGGKLGPVAGRVPATFKITDETRDLTKTYKVRVLKQRDLTPQMLATSALSAVFATYNSPGEGMAHVKLRIKGSKGHEITREDRYYHAGGLIMPAIGNLLNACTILTENRFRPQDVTELEYEAQLSNLDNTAAIEGLYADQAVAKAGEDLTLHVRLRPDDGDIVEKTVTLRMPLDLQKGRMRIGVSGGTDAMRMRSRLGVLPPTFYALEDVIDQFETAEQSDQLFVAAGTPSKKNISVQGTKLIGLPPSIQSVIEGSLRTDIIKGGTEISQTLDVPWVLYGVAQMTVQTEDREGRRGKGPPPKSGGPPDPGEASALPPLPRGGPASLWWAASAFTKPLAGDMDQSPHQAYRPFTLPRVNSEKPEKADKAEAEDKDEDKDEEDKEEKAEEPKDKKEGAVARQPSIWSQTTAKDFQAGEAEGIAIRSDGAVQLVPEWKKLRQFSELYVSSLAAGENVVYAGAMNDASIYRLDGEKCELLFETGEFGVSALCVDKSGAVLAATFPHGRIFRITPDGKGEQFCQLDADQVWDIISDGKAGYYAAVGPGAAVYHIDEQGKAEKLIEIRQSHAVRLLLVAENLYVATAEKGVLYRLGPDRKLVSLFDAGKNDLTALAPDPKGSILLATGPEGKVIAVDSSGAATALYEADGAGILSLLHTQGRAFAGLSDDGKIVEVVDPDTHSLLREDDAGQVTALCALGSKVYAGCANPGVVLVADSDAAATGKLDSDVLDAGRCSRWGVADWQATVPEGAKLTLRLRSGNSNDPEDESWSDWSLPIADPGRGKASAPPAQFLQYRLEMSKSAGAGPPQLDWLRVSYLPANQRPVVKDTKPKEGEAISAKFKLKWKMEDPDKDKLQAKVLARPRGKRDFKIIKEHLTAAEYEWNTKTMDDGVYDVRIVADDSLANPGDAEEGELDIANITIDNTRPEVEIISGPVEQTDGTFALTGFVLDAACPIANIAWQEKGGDIWRAARLDDGLYDWRYERFLIVTPPLKETVKEIVVRARDAAGNVTDETVKLPERKQAKKKKPGLAASSG